MSMANFNSSTPSPIPKKNNNKTIVGDHNHGRVSDDRDSSGNPYCNRDEQCRESSFRHHQI